MVDVSIHSEQSLEDDLYNCFKVSWEGNTEGTREYFFVVQLVLDPGHQEVYVFASADLERRFHVVPIGPQVLILWPCRHGRTRLSRAELSQDSVEDINLVVKLNSVNGEPLIEVLASG